MTIHLEFEVEARLEELAAIVDEDKEFLVNCFTLELINRMPTAAHGSTIVPRSCCGFTVSLDETDMPERVGWIQRFV